MCCIPGCASAAPVLKVRLDISSSISISFLIPSILSPLDKSNLVTKEISTQVCKLKTPSDKVRYSLLTLAAAPRAFAAPLSCALLSHGLPSSRGKFEP